MLKSILGGCGLALVIVCRAISAEPAPTTAPAEIVRRFSDTRATQGVAVDKEFFYAVSNSSIVKFDKKSGAQVASWSGDPARYPHINSCSPIDGELVCASSNYPAVPMQSTVEVFDLKTLAPIRSRALEDAPGSVTWIDRHEGRFWVGFANYDGRGGEPGRDHMATRVVAYDRDWKQVGAWRFPAAVLARFAPRSTSGGVWGDDGLLYVSGHDLPEVYALKMPETGDELIHVATIPVAIEGQAIAWDHSAVRQLYGITRKTGEVVVVRLPPIP